MDGSGRPRISNASGIQGLTDSGSNSKKSSTVVLSRASSRTSMQSNTSNPCDGEGRPTPTAPQVFCISDDRGPNHDRMLVLAQVEEQKMEALKTFLRHSEYRRKPSLEGKLPPIGGSFAGNGMARPHSATMHDNPKVQFDRNLRSARLQLGMVKQPTAITLTTGLVEPDHAPPRDFMKARADAVQRQFDMHLPPMALEKKKITERLVLQKQQQGRKHDLVLLAKLEAGNTEKLAAQLPPMPPPVKNQVKPMQPPSAKPCAVNTTGIPDKDSIGERNRDPSSQSWHSLGDVVSDIKDKSSKLLKSRSLPKMDLRAAAATGMDSRRPAKAAVEDRYMVENEQADDDVAEPDGPETTVAGDDTKSSGTEFEQYFTDIANLVPDWQEGSAQSNAPAPVVTDIHPHDELEVEREREAPQITDASMMTTEELLKATRSHPRKAPLPDRESWQLKSTFNKKVEEIEFRKVTKTRMDRMANRQKEAVRRTALDRHLKLDVTTREQQNIVEEKRAQLRPQPMDETKLLVQEHALENYEKHVTQHQEICARVAEKSKKAPGQLLMHIADEEVERTRMKTAIDDNMPHYDPKRRFLRGKDFFHQRRRMGGSMDGLHLTATFLESGQPKEPEFIGKPDVVTGAAAVRPRRWATAPYTSLAWSGMEKLLYEVNGILRHEPETSHLGITGVAGVPSGNVWKVPGFAPGKVTTTNARRKPIRRRAWRRGHGQTRSMRAAVRFNPLEPHSRTSGDNAEETGPGHAPLVRNNTQLLEAVNAERNAIGKKPLVRLPTHWRELYTGESNTTVYVRKDGKDQLNLKVFRGGDGNEAPGMPPAIAEIKDIYRWKPYNAWYRGRPVNCTNPPPPDDRPDSDPEGLVPRINQAVIKLDPAKQAVAPKSRQQEDHIPASEHNTPSVTGVKRMWLSESEIEDRMHSIRVGRQSAGTDLLDLIREGALKRHVDKNPFTEPSESVDTYVSEATDVSATSILTDEGSHPVEADAGKSVHGPLKHSESAATVGTNASMQARKMRKQSATEKMRQQRQLLSAQKLDDSSVTLVQSDVEACSGVCVPDGFRVAGNRIVFKQALAGVQSVQTRHFDDTEKKVETRNFWQCERDAQRPKILVGEYAFLYKEGKQALDQPCSKVINIYGEAKVGEVVLLPLPFYNDGKVRVDFDIKDNGVIMLEPVRPFTALFHFSLAVKNPSVYCQECSEENTLDTNIVGTDKYYSFYCQQSHRVTVGGDVGDILFGFRSLVSGMFRRRFIMTFTPRLENGNYVIIDVVGHAIGSPLTDNVNVVRAKEAEPLITRSPADASQRAGEYAKILAFREAEKKRLDYERRNSVKTLPYQLTKINRAIPVSDDEDEGKRPRSPARPVVRRRPKESIAMPDWLHDYRYKLAKEQRQKKREEACGASAAPAFASEDFHHHAENMTDSFGMENWMKSETPFPVLAQCCIASTVFRRELLAIESPPATDEVEKQGTFNFISRLLDDIVACVCDKPEPDPPLHRVEEEELFQALNPDLKHIHMTLLDGLETLHFNMVHEIDPNEEKMPLEASPKTAKAFEEKAGGGNKSAKGGKNAGKETKGDKNRKPSGKDKETKEPNTRPHVPFSRLAEGTLRVDPSTIWDYKASSVHSVIAAPPSLRTEDDHLQNALLLEELEVSTNLKHCANDSGSIRGNIFNTHQRTSAYIRSLVEDMVDSIADTCTSLRHKMDLPLGFDEEDPPAVAAAKEEPAPQTDKAGRKSGLTGTLAGKKADVKKKESKAVAKDTKKKDVGKGKTKQDAGQKACTTSEDGKTERVTVFVDPERCALFRELANEQVHERLQDMVKNMTVVEHGLEPEVALPHFDPMLVEDLGTLADPIAVDDVFSAIHQETLVTKRREKACSKALSSQDWFRRFVTASNMDRSEIGGKPGPKAEKVLKDPSKVLNVN